MSENFAEYECLHVYAAMYDYNQKDSFWVRNFAHSEYFNKKYFGG